MTVLNAIILGILQGLTEFLPVSSSGHLVVVEKFLNVHVAPEQLMGFDVLLHTGTLLALLIVYFHTWKRIALAPFTRDREALMLLLHIIIATLPAVAAGLFLKDYIVSELRSVTAVAGAFAMTGVILLLGEWAGKAQHKAINKQSALLIGCAQALALVPGLSRSGLTISAGRGLGLSREDALDFSFLMATPAIAGAGLLTLLDVMHGVALPEKNILLVGFFASAVASVSAILFLKLWVRRFSFNWFAYYLFALSGLLLFLNLN